MRSLVQQRGLSGAARFHWRHFRAAGNRRRGESPETAAVLLLGPSLQAVSGVSTHLNQLLGSSLTKGWRLLHFQVGSQGRREGALTRVLRLWWSPLRLARVLRAEQVPIVHINSSLDDKAFWRDLMYLAVARIMRRQIVFQVHGGAVRKFAFRNRMVLAIFRRALRLPHAIVVLSEVERGAYAEILGAQRLVLIPNAIELSEYGTVAKRFRITGEWRLVYVGRLAEDKGIADTVLALQRLRSEGWTHPARLLIAGSGPQEGELRALAEESGLAGQVELTGPLFGEQKRAFWLAADLFVFPTFHDEGLPYAVLESLASGTPMISTRIGGIPEVALEGVHALYVEPHRPDQVAHAMRALLDDPERLQRMSEAGLQRVQDSYGVERMAARFQAVYAGLVETMR